MYVLPVKDGILYKVGRTTIMLHAKTRQAFNPPSILPFKVKVISNFGRDLSPDLHMVMNVDVKPDYTDWNPGSRRKNSHILNR